MGMDHDHFGGHKMERTFITYTDLPMGEEALTKKGWHKQNDECDPHLGFAWTEEKLGNTRKKPIVLYTTKGGQPSGVGMMFVGLDGQEPLPEEQKKWATKAPMTRTTTSEASAHVDVAFRSGEILCSGEKDDAPVGTTLIVNPAGDAGTSLTIPITEAGVKDQGWHRGSCFDGMGWHWFFDTSKRDGEMSWMADNLFPIVTMFHEGELNAIFFAAHQSQISLPFLAANEWEPAALDNENMCKNTCDKECDFKGVVDKWSTAHIYFRDHKEVTCPSDLTCGITFPLRANCCEVARADVVV